jgi:hypothetical protein
LSAIEQETRTRRTHDTLAFETRSMLSARSHSPAPALQLKIFASGRCAAQHVSKPAFNQAVQHRTGGDLLEGSAARAIASERRLALPHSAAPSAQRG